MILDSFLPHPDVSEHHELVIPARPSVVYRAIWEADLGSHAVIRALLALRSLPARLGDSSLRRFQRLPITLSVILQHGFQLLAEEPEREVVLGVVGRFWRPMDTIVAFDPAAFTAPLAPGLAKAAWNFSVAAKGDETVLSTETRVACADPASLRRFKLYWIVVGPFSGLIRILMLRAIHAHSIAV